MLTAALSFRSGVQSVYDDRMNTRNAAGSQFGRHKPFWTGGIRIKKSFDSEMSITKPTKARQQ
jgi:hypothetical protein